jgi:hypothetical protein
MFNWQTKRFYLETKVEPRKNIVIANRTKKNSKGRGLAKKKVCW